MRYDVKDKTEEMEVNLGNTIPETDENNKEVNCDKKTEKLVVMDLKMQSQVNSITWLTTTNGTDMHERNTILETDKINRESNAEAFEDEVTRWAKYIDL